MTDRDLMQQALDALELHAKQYPHMVKGYTADAAAITPRCLFMRESQPIVVCLLPARTNTAWWHDWVMKGEVRFIRGEVAFKGQKNGLWMPMAIVVMAHNAKVSGRPHYETEKE